ncbi:MAG: hypothetical protein DRP46_09495 [Candidatus Zixiibacteriota bacterium]|nr:MAG: hypothetical protein DRP46_09495 [candidate division Zixibacteria bacterium]
MREIISGELFTKVLTCSSKMRCDIVAELKKECCRILTEFDVMAVHIQISDMDFDRYKLLGLHPDLFP